MQCITAGFLMMVAFLPLAWAEPATKPTPADDLKALQGRWTVTEIFWPLGDERRLPKEVRLNETGTLLVVEGNRIIYDGKAVATLANDLALADQQKAVGFVGNRLLMLTLPDGIGLLCSYHVKGDKVQITYTHTCSCHRGSGQVVYLERTSK